MNHYYITSVNGVIIGGDYVLSGKTKYWINIGV